MVSASVTGGHAVRPSVSAALARDRLGPFAVGTAIASSVAPLTVTALVVSSALAVTGLVGVPVAVVAVATILMLFVVGYVAMARHIPNAGAFYAYVAQGVGRPWGVGAAWLALATYNAFQLCCYGGFGAAIAAPLIADWTGVEVPWFVPALAAWALVAVLGANEIRLSEKVLVALVVAETVLVLAYTVVIMVTPGFAFSAAGLDPGSLWGPGAGTLLVIGMTAFAGVEQSAVYIEESKDPRRTIPVATYATIATIAVVYVAASWVQISAAGPDVVDRAAIEGPDLFFNQAAVLLGGAATQGGHLLLGTSLLAAMLAFHNAVARYLFALGREGVAPRAFGRTTLKGAPRHASAAQTVLAFAVIVVYAVTGWDPLVQLFYWGSTAGGLGVLLLITATSAAVVAFFARDPRGETLWRRRIAPLTATIILLIVAWLAVDNLPTLFGVDAGTGPALIVPAAYTVIFAVGCAWGRLLSRTRPHIYTGIGRGTRSAAATTGLSALPTGPGTEGTHR